MRQLKDIIAANEKAAQKAGIANGVTPHSSDAGQGKYVIFSVSVWNLVDLVQVLSSNNIGHKKLVGCYKGKEEDSWIIKYDDFPLVFKAGLLGDQESVLILGPCDARDRRPAKLAFLNPLDNSKELGKFHSVSEATAKAQDAWTYDPGSKEYFITTEEE
jgi:hypothetical protein